MTYELKLHGPIGYGFTPFALPEDLRNRHYAVVKTSFVPDGGIYTPMSRDIVPIKIPTGTLTFTLEFDDGVMCG